MIQFGSEQLLTWVSPAPPTNVTKIQEESEKIKSQTPPLANNIPYSNNNILEQITIDFFVCGLLYKALKPEHIK